MGIRPAIRNDSDDREWEVTSDGDSSETGT
jgi:hypothetical protein